MYERNAIVLERYFDKIFNFKNSSNLRENYFNYRELFECYGKLCDAKEKETNCQDEFNSASKEICKLQKDQENLYNKGAKFEYSRYIIFNNITETPEIIEKHLNKVAEDVQKNTEELKELSEKFVQAINDYNEKENNLKQAIEERENAQNEYDNIYSIAQKCYNEITEDEIEMAKDFIDSDNKENKKELQEIFDNNGKKEKNKFDPDVISNTIVRSLEIYKSEMDIYCAGYDRISKLFEEIDADSVKKDKHTKYYKDSKAKIDFQNAKKDYIIQFLDNERIGAIYEKKVHRKLMLEACKKFALDFDQIDKLYEIILKEVSGRSTKKIYKENYNKKYFVELENSSVEPSLDTGRMRQEAIAFVNLNYWRIEGMRRVYETFEEIVTNVYEKDLEEFIPEELKEKTEEIAEEIIEEITEIHNEEVVSNSEQEDDIQVVQENKVENKVGVKVKPRRIFYSSKLSLANAIYFSLQTHEFGNNKNEIQEEIEEIPDEQYSVPEQVQEIISNFEEEQIQDNVNFQENDSEDTNIENDNFDLGELDEIEDDEELIEENSEYLDSDDEYTEDSIIEFYFNDSKKKTENTNKSTINTLNKRVGLFKKLVGFNSKKKKEA